MLPEIPYWAHWLHQACKLSTGQRGHSWEACPPPHWPLPASHSGWKGAESLLHRIPPRRQYLALNSPYQFGIAKLEFLRFIPKAVKVEHATGPGCDAEPMLRSLEFY